MSLKMLYETELDAELRYLTNRITELKKGPQSDHIAGMLHAYEDVIQGIETGRFKGMATRHNRKEGTAKIER